jgi:hypothetical protein
MWVISNSQSEYAAVEVVIDVSSRWLTAIEDGRSPHLLQISAEARWRSGHDSGTSFRSPQSPGPICGPGIVNPGRRPRRSSKIPSLATKCQTSADCDQDYVTRKKWDGQNEDKGDQLAHSAHREAG